MVSLGLEYTTATSINQPESIYGYELDCYEKYIYGIKCLTFCQI